MLLTSENALSSAHTYPIAVSHTRPKERSASSPHVPNSHPPYKAFSGPSLYVMSPDLCHQSIIFFLQTSQSPTPCSSIKRQVGCSPRTPRRRRYNIRPESIMAPRVINFDSLPWISALDDPVLTAGNLWDSDLSQLAEAESMTPSLGPVRRRKSISLSRDRTEPLVPLVSSPPSGATSTPPPRFPSPSRVQFFGLMPAMTPRPALH